MRAILAAAPDVARVAAEDGRVVVHQPCSGAALRGGRQRVGGGREHLAADLPQQVRLHEQRDNLRQLLKHMESRDDRDSTKKNSK